MRSKKQGPHLPAAQGDGGDDDSHNKTSEETRYEHVRILHVAAYAAQMNLDTVI